MLNSEPGSITIVELFGTLKASMHVWYLFYTEAQADPFFLHQNTQFILLKIIYSTKIKFYTTST